MTTPIKPTDRGDATRDPEKGFLHAGLIQCGLPRGPFEGREFIRQNGRKTLVIQAGNWGPDRIPQFVPYGTIPRFLLIYICSQAAASGYRTTAIDVDRSANAFLGRLGVSMSGQARKNFRRQMTALAVCQMALIESDGKTTQDTFLKPVRSFSAWQVSEDGEKAAWPRALILTSDFLEALREHAVPFDQHAVAKLRGSSLAIDAYLWLAYRLWEVPEKGEYLSWDALKGQFGHEYSDVKYFRREMKAALDAALAVYPGARLEFPRGRVKLFRSPPPIAPRLVPGATLRAVEPPAVPAPPPAARPKRARSMKADNFTDAPKLSAEELEARRAQVAALLPKRKGRA